MDIKNHTVSIQEVTTRGLTTAWDQFAVFLECSCGWESEITRYSEGDGYGRGEDVDAEIRNHKIEILLERSGIVFDTEILNSIEN